MGRGTCQAAQARVRQTAAAPDVAGAPAAWLLQPGARVLQARLAHLHALLPFAECHTARTSQSTSTPARRGNVTRSIMEDHGQG